MGNVVKISMEPNEPLELIVNAVLDRQKHNPPMIRVEVDNIQNKCTIKSMGGIAQMPNENVGITEDKTIGVIQDYIRREAIDSGKLSYEPSEVTNMVEPGKSYFSLRQKLTQKSQQEQLRSIMDAIMEKRESNPLLYKIEIDTSSIATTCTITSKADGRASEKTIQISKGITIQSVLDYLNQNVLRTSTLNYEPSRINREGNKSYFSLIPK